MRLRIIFLICTSVFFFCNDSFGKDTDKLIESFDAAEPLKKIELFFLFQGDLERINVDSTVYFIENIYEIAKETQRDDLLAFSDFFYGLYFRAKGMLDESWERFYSSMEYFKKVENDTMISTVYNNYGIIHYLKGNILDAEEAYLSSSLAGKKSGISKFQYFSLNNLFRCYIAQERYNEANEIIQAYLDFYQSENDVKNIANAYGLFGQLNLELEAYDEAIEHFERSLEFSLVNGTPLMVANGYTNLAITHYFQDDFLRAKQYFKLALSYRKMVGIDFYIIEAYHNLGDFFQGISEYDSALVYYNNALEIAENTGNKKAVYDVYSELSDIFERLGDYKSQSEALKKMVSLNAVIMKLKSKSDLQATRLKFEREKDFLNWSSSNKISVMEERVASINKIWDYWIITLSCGLFLIVSIWFYRNRLMKKEQTK